MNETIQYKKVANVSSQIEAEILTSRLRAIGISSTTQEPGAGNYLKITGYGSVLGHDIYVAEEDYEQALEIVNDYQTISANETSAVKKIRQIGAIILLIIFVGGILLNLITL